MTSAIETIEGIRLIEAALPGVLTVLGVSNVSFGINPAARKVINAVFLYHCIKAGLDLAIIHPSHVVPFAEIPTEERDLAEDLIFNTRPDALQRLIEFYEGKTEDTSAGGPDPMAEMTVRERLHYRIVFRKKEGIEADIDQAVAESGDAVEVLNNVLLPAMKEVGDKFGAGELILPFVLQSAEAMKKAVSQLENYLEKVEGSTKGNVVLATVYGDVHDIGKNLVNTILTNNGYTVHDLGKQVPISTIIDKAVEVERDRDRALRPARLDQQADAALRQGAAPRRAQVPGHDRRRGDQPALRPPLAVRGGRHRLRGGRVLRQGRLRGPLADGPHHRARASASKLVGDTLAGGPEDAQQAEPANRSSPRPTPPTRPVGNTADRRAAGRAVLRRAGDDRLHAWPMSGRTST